MSIYQQINALGIYASQRRRRFHCSLSTLKMTCERKTEHPNTFYTREGRHSSSPAYQWKRGQASVSPLEATRLILLGT